VLRELRAALASGALELLVVVCRLPLVVVRLLARRFEQNASGANITTAGDALWWGYVTATTVGYGDYYPVTAGGRISALIMLTVGVGLFATFSGFLASTFLSPRKRQPPPPATPQIAEIRALVEQQEATVAELRAKLEQLEYA
jgi:voltage-gated potassium channel